MSTRAVDLQALLFRLQDVQQIQTTNQQQPQVTQSQFTQMFVNQTDVRKEQVQNSNHTEETKIRDKTGGRGGQRRQRRQQKTSSSEQSVPLVPQVSPHRIDIRV